MTTLNGLSLRLNTLGVGHRFSLNVSLLIIFCVFLNDVDLWCDVFAVSHSSLFIEAFSYVNELKRTKN